MLLAFCFACVPLPTVHAATTVTQTFYSSSSDGQISATSTTYSTAQAAATGTVADTAATFSIGQKKDGSNYYIYRGFVFFDTENLPDTATLTAAVLSLYIDTDASNVNFNTVVTNGQPTYPTDPLATGDYDKTHYSGSGASVSTSAISGAGYWNLTLDATGRSWVSLTGDTKLCLRSNEDISESAPPNNEYIVVKSQEAGSEYTAKLIITYTLSEGYVYYVHGPYTDAPVEVYDGAVQLQLFSSESDSETYTLDGTGDAEDYIVIPQSTQPLLMSWNISSTGNYSRVMYFSDITEQIYVFVPSDNTPTYLYEFSVIDMQGISNGFLESRLYYNGAYRVVERQRADTINAVSMYMQWAVAYNLRVVCDEGTLDTGTFTALAVTSNTVIIAYGAFPVSLYGNNATVTVSRMNATWIQMNFTDPDESTDWVYLLIKHKTGSTTYATDHTANNTGSTIQVNWYDAEETTDYLAVVTFLRDSTTYNYTFACPAPPGIENPWDFIDEPYCYAIAAACVICVGLVFSYATIVAGAWGMVGFALFFVAIGWLPQTTTTYTLIGFGGLISGLITIAEWKKTEREI